RRRSHRVRQASARFASGVVERTAADCDCLLQRIGGPLFSRPVVLVMLALEQSKVRSYQTLPVRSNPGYDK
ncbi:MAG: hypothetical protein ABIN08_04210, partial [Caldimonas sp.]